MKAQLYPALEELLFTASITSLALQGLTRQTIPRTSGTVSWHTSKRGAILTIIDPTAADITALAGVFPLGSICRVGIAVAVKSKGQRAASAKGNLATDMLREYVEKGLFPQLWTKQRSIFDGIYRRHTDGYELIPLTRIFSLPGQLVEYGSGEDGVRVHVSQRTVNRRHHSTALQDHVQLEVQLGLAAIRGFDLLYMGDLLKFKFRRRLMPFLMHSHGTYRTQSSEAFMNANDQQRRTHEALEREDARRWRSKGIAAFLDRDESYSGDLSLRRDWEMNYRIGNALSHLQKRIAVSASATNDRNSLLGDHEDLKPENASELVSKIADKLKAFNSEMSKSNIPERFTREIKGPVIRVAARSQELK